ncbi:MAG: biopolymer transporter ExbD [Pseudomonadales bacterium]|nr:biopolymer transporter ExbD [Pseudomonadales bacterium]
MKFLKQKRETVDVNLTPLIDVVFLLLIFFMVSTTFTKETRLTLELPEADGEAPANIVDMIEITISADGNYAVNGNTVINKKIETLKFAISKIAPADGSLASDPGSGANQSRPMMITADAMAPHQAVVTAMDAAGQMGFVNLSITTKRPVESK